MIEYKSQDNDIISISTRLNEISIELNKIANSMQPSQESLIESSQTNDDCMPEINNLVMSLHKHQLQQFIIESAQKMTKFERENCKNRLLDQYVTMPNFIKNINTVSVGDTVFFGCFKSAEDSRGSYVNSCGTDVIEWQVLETANNRILLLSKYALTTKGFETGFEKDLVIWDTCSLRKWLNDYFFKTSFNADEQSMILSTEISTTREERNMETIEYETNDKIFLLSQNEAVEYFPYEDIRICYNGEIAFSRSSVDWWTRSVAGDYIYVNTRGRIRHSGRHITRLGVRPALWIKKYDV